MCDLSGHFLQGTHSNTWNLGSCHVYGCLWNFLIKLDHSMNLNPNHANSSDGKGLEGYAASSPDFISKWPGLWSKAELDFKPKRMESDHCSEAIRNGPASPFSSPRKSAQSSDKLLCRRWKEEQVLTQMGPKLRQEQLLKCEALNLGTEKSWQCNWHNLQSLYWKRFRTSTLPIPIDPIEVCLGRIKALIL